MRKFFYGLGIVAASIFIIFLFSFGYVLYAGRGLDRESKEYVDEAVTDITKHWDKDALLSRASPALLASIKSEDVESLFVMFNSLGPLIDYQGAKGDTNFSMMIGQGVNISARYVAKGKFKGGDAEIEIGLIKIDGLWKIQGFHVNSPAMITNAVGRKT